MLFYSPEFILVFLPVVWGVFLWSLGASKALPSLWLAAASIVFYYLLDGPRLLVLLGVLLGTYLLSRRLAAERRPRRRRALLLVGIAANLLCLAYFKYAYLFFPEPGYAELGIIAPIGVSFFVLQQVIYLVQLYKRQIELPAIADFLLFGTFFPYIIAGPLVYGTEIFPQLRALDRPSVLRMAMPALILFSLGLFKKVVIADSLAIHADAVFAAHQIGAPLGAADAWAGAVAYMFQLYFDFSGYSDMAMALAALFGVRLPINFYSPYKATSIADFWRRWHMSIMRFLTAYIYLPLAMTFTRWSMKRGHGRAARFFFATTLPLLIAFLLVAWWHGVGWTAFVVMMAIALSIANAWRAFGMPALPVPLSWGLTMLAVLGTMLFDRTASVHDAGLMLVNMMGAGGESHIVPASAMLLLVVLGFVVLLAPNTHEIMAAYPLYSDDGGHGAARYGERMRWVLSEGGAVAAGIVAVLSFVLMTRASDFVYYRF